MNIIRYFSRKNAHIFFHRVLKDVQIDLADEVLKIKTKDIDKTSSGVFIDRLVQDTTRIGDIFIELNFSIMEIVTNIGLLLAIFVINKVMFLYYIFAIIVVFVIERIRITKRIEIDKKFRKIAEKATGLIGELVRGVRDIKVLNAQKSFMKKVSDEITNVNDERYKKSTVNRRYTFLSSSSPKVTFLNSKLPLTFFKCFLPNFSFLNTSLSITSKTLIADNSKSLYHSIKLLTIYNKLNTLPLYIYIITKLAIVK